MLSERGSDAGRSTKCVGALRRAVKLPCRNLCLPASAASPATATTSARCPHRDLYPAVSQATAMVPAKTVANHQGRFPRLHGIAVTRLMMRWRQSRSLESTVIPRIRPNRLHIDSQRVNRGIREQSPSILGNQQPFKGSRVPA